jgi:hypothetical protein
MMTSRTVETTKRQIDRAIGQTGDTAHQLHTAVADPKTSGATRVFGGRGMLVGKTDGTSRTVTTEGNSVHVRCGGHGPLSAWLSACLKSDPRNRALLGGVSFTGGRGTVFGIVLGVLFLGVLQNGLAIMNVSFANQQIANGLALVVATALEVTAASLAGRSALRRFNQAVMQMSVQAADRPAVDAAAQVEAQSNALMKK